MSNATLPPPIGKPQKISAAVDERRAGVLSSAAIAIMFGSAAPNPRPASSRAATSVPNSPDEDDAQCEHTKHRYRGHEHRLAADTIGEPAAECGAQHHADVADGEHPLHFAGAESELRCEPRSGYAHGLDIEALEHGDCHAQRNWNGNLHYEPPMGSNGSPT